MVLVVFQSTGGGHAVGGDGPGGGQGGEHAAGAVRAVRGASAVAQGREGQVESGGTR